ncbi:DnaJ [Rhynchospora pubera]|uniref:DnaJ n=1 Tax=Rhynchospora pubera TaxID=906938 RepID=A0AAV8G9S6_9POAL|nr:DnaJ [Rhynchospora pubera]
MGPSNLPEKMQTWHPFNSGTESKANSNQDGAFVFGVKSKENCGFQIRAENGTPKENGSSDFGSSSSLPEEKLENVTGNFPKEKSDCATNEKEEARSFVPGSDMGPASTLPEEMEKLNLQNEKTVHGSENRDADVLPEKVEKLNLESGSGNSETKPPVFLFGTELNDNTGFSHTSSKSTYPEQFVFGSSANTFSDNMKNINTSKERESYTPGAFSFNFRDWETATQIPETTLPDAMKKLEIGARKTAGLRDKKGKKKPTRLGKSTTAWPHGPSLVPEYSGRACSSEKDEQVPIPGSPASCSPMECSPYPENYASDDTYKSTSLEVEAEVDLSLATERLQMKEENVNENQKLRSEEVGEKGTRGEGAEALASGASLNFDGPIAGQTFTTFNTGNKEEAGEGMDYVGSSYNVDMGNTASGSSFRFTSSTSGQGPAPMHRRHFRRKNRVMRGPVESTEDHVMSSSVQPSSLWSNESTPPGKTRIDLGKQEARSRMEAKKETARTSGMTGGMSGSALEACEKWRMRGNQAYADGRLQKAEEYYTRGINSITPEERSGSCVRALMLCYSNRAATRMSLGRMKEAFVDCLIALENDQGFLRARVRAANCLLALGEVEEAVKYYNQCIQSDGVDSKILTEAREGLVKAEKLTQYVDEAMQLLQKGTSAEVTRLLELISDAMLIGTNSDNLMEMKAKALLLLRRYEEVIQLCDQSSDLAEKNSNLGRSGARDPRLWRWALVAKSYFYLGKLEETLQVLKKYDEVKPIDERCPEIYPSPAVIGELLRLKASGNEAFQAGRYAEAIESYTGALTYNGSSRPFSAICLANRAAAYQAQGQIMDAIADCSIAIALDPNYAKAISRRATLYETIRDYGQALSDLHKLIALLEKQSHATQLGKSSKANTELHRTSARLSSMEEEARRRTPLNMYLILGIEPTSSTADIKKAYRKAALRHHPDKAGQFLVRSETIDDALWNEIVQEVHKDADHLFKTIGEAYNVLSDETKKLKYDLDEEIRSGKKGYYNGSDEYSSKHHYERSSSRHSWKSHYRWSDDYW